MKTIQDAGMPAEISESENDEYLEVVIRLPKKDLQQQNNSQENNTSFAG